MAVESKLEVVHGDLHLDSHGNGMVHGARETILSPPLATLADGVALTTIHATGKIYVPFWHRLRGVSFGYTSATAVTPGTDPAADLYRHLPRPTGFTGALASPAVAGLVTDGAHFYAIVFYNGVGNGAQSDVISVTVADKTTNGKVLLQIPIGPTGTTGRKIYRSEAAGSALKLLATVANNTDTTYLDNIADASLGAAIGSGNVAGATVLTGTVKLTRAAATSADAVNVEEPLAGTLAAGVAETVYPPCMYTVRALTGATTGALAGLFAALQLESYPS
jgi:hypothetical protein